MAVVLNIGDMDYVGTFTLGGAVAVSNGTYVSVNYATGVALPVTATVGGDGDIFLVDNIIDTVPEQLINDLSFLIQPGKFLRLHKEEYGDITTNSLFNGTPNIGDILAAGANGYVEAIGTRTPRRSFTVIEKPMLWGIQTIKYIVNDK
jgi:hypothetical protein